MADRVSNFIPTLLLLLLTVTLLFPSPSSARPSAQNPGVWRMTFDEEFRGRRLDPHKWTASVGVTPNRSEPLQYFLPEDVSVGQGHLRLTSEHRPFQGRDYTSGEIRTLDKFSQKYGRLETRCRFPVAYGTWSAVYLLPADDSWPPEIDAAEYIGRSPDTLYLTNHWQDSAGEHQQANQDWTTPTMDWGQWHTYAVEWEPGRVQWSVDGVPRPAIDGPVSDKPMYVRVNTSVGGVFAYSPHASYWPQTFDIDYIRVYQRRGGPPPIWGPVPHFVPPPSAVSDPNFVSPPEPSQAPQTDHADWALNVTLDLLLMGGVWLAVRRRAGSGGAGTAALAAGVGLSAVQYTLFRVQVVSWAAWGIAVPLLLAEAHGLAQTLGLQYTLWPRPPLPLHPRPGRTAPPVFVLIPTVNEGVAVLEPTLRGAFAARARYLEDFPAAQITVAVCNDGRVAGFSGWQEVERLAESLGAVCVTRTVGGGAKAGNLEWARQTLGATGNCLLALFDADQIAAETFFQRTLPPLADPSVGWVQTGQYYRNLENPVARWADDQQALFYRVLCPGKAALNAAFICGTNVVIRASALDEIGGLPQDSVTEDFAASLLLHARWRSVFLSERLAEGLGPMDLASYFAQQGRWATGTLGTLRRHGRLLFGSEPGGLSFAQRVQYGLACTHYLSGLRDLIFLIAPFLFLLLGVSAITGTDMPGFLGRFLPYYVLSQIAFWRVAWGKTGLRGIALGFASFPALLASLVLVVCGARVRFAVTPKHRVRLRARSVLLTQKLAGAGCLVGLVLAWAGPGDRSQAGFSALWLLTMLLLLASVIRLDARTETASIEAVEQKAPKASAD